MKGVLLVIVLIVVGLALGLGYVVDNLHPLGEDIKLTTYGGDGTLIDRNEFPAWLAHVLDVLFNGASFMGVVGVAKRKRRNLVCAESGCAVCSELFVTFADSPKAICPTCMNSANWWIGQSKRDEGVIVTPSFLCSDVLQVVHDILDVACARLGTRHYIVKANVMAKAFNDIEAECFNAM